MDDRRNSYADFDADPADVLHGAARLHVALGRMDDTGISTRGWTYNDLVRGILFLGDACLEVLFDTLDAIVEIGPAAVEYLNQWEDHPHG